MDILAIVKSLEQLGMVGLSLAVACGLAYVIVKREQDGMSQLKLAIEALTLAITGLQKQQETTKHLNEDVREIKKDVALLKTAIVHVGVRSISKD